MLERDHVLTFSLILQSLQIIDGDEKKNNTHTKATQRNQSFSLFTMNDLI